MKVLKSRIKGMLALICTLVIVFNCVPVCTFAASKSVTVTNQKELEAALKNGRNVTIVIAEGETSQYMVPKGKYSKTTLVVDADGVSVTVKKGAKIGTLILAGDDIKVSNSGSVSKISTDMNYNILTPDDADNGDQNRKGDLTAHNAASRIGYITKEQTKVETKYIVFDIDPNVYVIPDLAVIVDKIFETIETVTGLKAKNGKYYDGKIVCHVNREGAKDTLVENYGWEMGTVDEFWITPMDLFVESGYVFTHELGHSFNREFTGGFAGTLVDEGFTTYTELKVMEYLWKNDPYLAAIVGCEDNVTRNMTISDYDAMYAQSVEYWMAHRDEAESFCWNSVYGIGFRLMAFLEAKYGNYTKWFDEYDRIASAETKKRGLYSIDSLPDEVIFDLASKAMKNTYGKKVFEDFYKWMKKNEGGRLDNDFDEEINHFKNVSEYTVYPKYYSFSNYTKLGEHRLTEYKDLIVNIAPAEYYLRVYKGEDTSKLVLNVSLGVTVERYDKNGKKMDNVASTEIPLKDVAYVKLVGTGKTAFSITGYNIYDKWAD